MKIATVKATNFYIHSHILNYMLTVSSAAKSVGYTDIFNFSKMFKRHFGMPPNEYVKSKL